MLCPINAYPDVDISKVKIDGNYFFKDSAAIADHILGKTNNLHVVIIADILVEIIKVVLESSFFVDKYH